MAKSAQEKALTAALVAVARSMGADEELVGRIRDAVNPKKRKTDEVWLNTRQVMERLGLSKKTVLGMTDTLGVVRHSSRLLRYPLSHVLAWAEGDVLAPSTTPSEQ